MTFEGESDESPDHAAGDVVVRLKSKTKVGGFARKESNLIWKETLSVAEVSSRKTFSRGRGELIMVFILVDFRRCWDSREQSRVLMGMIS